MTMQAKKKLKPGQHGTKKLIDQYGSHLICVRYRYDEERQMRYKTVELIIEAIPWKPKPARVRGEMMVGVRVNLKEVELQRRVKQAGGQWNRARQLWELRYDQAMALGLEARIAPQDMANTRKAKRPTIR